MKSLISRTFSCIVLGVALAAAPADAQREPGVTDFSGNDAGMNAAIAAARAKLPEFIGVLRAAKANQSHFSVKAHFDTARGGEHIWVGDVKFDGTAFQGRLENVPRSIPSLKHGDNVTIAIGRVSDWLYVEDGALKGAYTLRVIYERMTDAERQQFRRQLPYRLEW